MARRTLHLLRSEHGLQTALTAAFVAVAGTACAPAQGRPVLGVAPMCTVSSSPYWEAPKGGKARTLAVRLSVLSEASASWRVDGRARLDAAIAAWNRAGVPVRLVRMSSADPEDSVDIRVVVLRRLPLDPIDRSSAYRAGVTHLRYDAAGAIGDAQVLIAEETPRGEPYSVSDQAATLLHEIGHALGVPHSDRPFALMSPHAHAVSLTPHDVALARAVYGRRNCAPEAALTASRDE